MKKGTVKWFDSKKNFGFIIPEEKGSDVWFHASVVDGQPLTEGDKVQFETEDHAKGIRAKYVSRA